MIYSDELGDQREAYKAISVDGDGTQMIDDLFDIEKIEDYYRLRIFLVDVIGGLEKSRHIDQAISLGQSRYWPLTQKNIFSDKQIREMSFSENVYRKAIMIECRIDDDGTVIDYGIDRVYAMNVSAFSFSQCGEIINSYFDDEFSLKLKMSAELSKKLKDLRVADYVSKLTQEKRDWKKIEKKMLADSSGFKAMHDSVLSSAGFIIREFMVLANRLFAEFSHAKKIPIIYKTMEDEEAELISLRRKQILYSLMREAGLPVRMANEFYMLHGSTFSYSKTPGRHAGVNMDMYTEFTSPLRSGVCVVNHYALSKYLWDVNKVSIDKDASEYCDHFNDLADKIREELKCKVVEMLMKWAQKSGKIKMVENILLELKFVSTIIMDKGCTQAKAREVFSIFDLETLDDWLSAEGESSLPSLKRVIAEKYCNQSVISEKVLKKIS